MPEKCPSEVWLMRLVEGDVTEQQEAKLSAHLDHCKHCQARLEQANQDGLAILSAEAERKQDHPSVLRARLDEVRAERKTHHKKTTSGFADVSPWLEPDQDSVGRIHEFQLTEFVGRGGMGIVFKGFDEKLQRAVAVKFMSPGLLADPNASQRFLREARAAAKINHANVVTVHTVDETNGLPFLVMEWIEGDSLEDLLARSPELPTNEILRIGLETGRGLEAAHHNRVIHRDIKPSNLMIDVTGHVKITDFGLASGVQEKELTRTGMMVGTPDYASPEQIEGKKTDARSDLFSLGCVLYQMCTGALPFASDSLFQTMKSVQQANFDRSKLDQSNCPVALIRLIYKLLNKSPQERFPNANSFCEAIEGVTARPPIPRSQFTIKEKSPTSTPYRGKYSYGIVASIGLLLFVSLAVTLLQGLTPKESTDQVEANLAPNVSETPADSGILVSDEKELLRALANEGNLNIQLAPGRVFELSDPIVLENRDIVLMGSGAELPTLKLKAFEDFASIEVQSGSIKLEKIKLLDAASQKSDEALISCDSGNLEIVDSLVQCKRRQHCLMLSNVELKIVSSVLIGNDKIATASPKPRQTIVISNSLLVSPTNLEIDEEFEFNFEANNSVFISWTMFELNASRMEDMSVKFTGSNTSVISPDAIFSHHLEEEESIRIVANDFKNRFSWQANQWDIPKTLLLYVTDRSEREISWKQASLRPDPQSTFIDPEKAESLLELSKTIQRTKIESVRQINEVIANYRTQD